MFVPLDRRINDRVPAATFALAAANVVCFFALFWTASGPEDLDLLWRRWGYVSASPSASAVLTHLFIHSGWQHLAGNMLFLVLLGMNCERRLGGPVFLAIYFLSGLGAIVLFGAFNRGSTTPCVGASGAVSGVAGVYLALFARREVEVLWYLLVTAGTIRLPAWSFTLLWAGTEAVQAALLNKRVTVAHWAHVGGFLAGLGATALLVRVAGFRGRADPPSAPAPRPDAFDELGYIPEKPAPAQTFFLVAREFRPPSGLLDSGLAASAARELQGRLAAEGRASFVLAESARVHPPPLRLLREVAVRDGRLHLADDLGAVHVKDPASVYFVAAGTVRTPAGERRFLDLFTTSPWTDFRLAGEGPIAELRALLRKTVAEPGEPFADLAAWDAFLLWLLQLQAGGVYRKPGD